MIEFVDVGATNAWGHLKDGVLRACDEACWKKRERRRKGHTWWRNEEVKEAISRKKYTQRRCM